MNFDFVIPRVACTLLIVFCSGFSHTGEWVKFEGKHLCHFRSYLFFFILFYLFVCLFVLSPFRLRATGKGSFHSSAS